ncbi:MAG: protein-disulfide reductase DsbD domain-containing protein [Gemmobacter sp.]
MPAAPTRAEGIGEILSAELLPGWRTDHGTHMAAVRLRLAQGWKTYWRAPGDAGIPPDFDWQGSENIRSVRFHWPKPTVFTLNGMQTIGYARELVLPVEIVPGNPDAPIRVAAQVELGVCRDVCVPARLSLDADLLPVLRYADPAIKSALASRPKRAAEAGVRSHGCRIDPTSDGLSVTAEIDMPRIGPRETVVIETADPSVWVSEAQATRSGGRLVARAEMVAATRAPFALDRSGLTITVLGEGSAVELSGCPAR